MTVSFLSSKTVCRRGHALGALLLLFRRVLKQRREKPDHKIVSAVSDVKCKIEARRILIPGAEL